MAEEIKQPANSIELSRNAKGEYSYHIKCRGDNFAEVGDRIEMWEERLNGKYPVKANDKAVKDANGKPDAE